MIKLFAKWLKIYEDEIGLFLWSAFLLFLIRSSNIIFNNFSQTAFLKRFGVEYLPIINVVNSVSTFLIMGVMAGFMIRLPGTRLLAYTLVLCGSTVAALRLVIPLDFDLLYPVLFVLNTQYAVLLALLFWNLASDLFNTRQSKRIFPLVTAGGIIGAIVGSFATPHLAKMISMNNLMFAYFGMTLAGATAASKMGKLYPATLLSDKGVKKKKSAPSLIEELRGMIPLLKESTLAKILILITLLPNIVIPIITYQFNFAVDRTYPTEGEMIGFFGYFRGVQNIISLIIALFVGRIYSRFGLPVALMFHPFNYVLAFLAFLLRFDIFSAVYARLSTGVLRNTINNPARGVLFNLFPASYRAVIRPFLRGTVVRVGVLVGSGIVLLSQGVMHPRFLSLVAVLFVIAWIGSTLFLKRVYSEVLLDLISRERLDLKSLEETEAEQIFKDKRVQSQLVQSFLSARGEECVWYGRLLNSLGVEGLDAHILSIFKEQDDRTKMGLLSLLSSQAGKEALEVFREQADPDKPELMVAFAMTAKRVYADMPMDLQREIFEAAPIHEVKAYMVIGLHRQEPLEYKGVIDAWLDSDSLPEKRAGVLAAGESENRDYIEKLEAMLKKEEDESIIPMILKALHRLGAPGMNILAYPLLSHPVERVRLAAIDVLEIDSDEAARKMIGLMGDPSDQVRERAIEKLDTASYPIGQSLVESLITPSRRVRDGIFQLVESMDIKDVDAFRFYRTGLDRAYTDLAEVEALRQLPESGERDLLMTHLDQRKMFRLENVLRGMAARDRSGQMKTIWRGLSSVDSHTRANSLEALENLMDRALSRIIMPLLENPSPSECLAVGRKHFRLPDFESGHATLSSHLLAKDDWVTVALTLYFVAKQDLAPIDMGTIEELTRSENSCIRQLALWAIEGRPGEPYKNAHRLETELSVPDKILHLRGIQLFEGLSVSELAAIALRTEEVVCGLDEIVIKEGEPGDRMYLIIEGQVSVLKGGEEGRELELDRMEAGNYFGEMALFEDIGRSASIRTTEKSRFMTLGKRAFEEIMEEYPEIALHTCKELSLRIRRLHDRLIRNQDSS